MWGFGSFVVLALAMRLFLFRKVRDGMTARYDRIEGDFAGGREPHRRSSGRRRRLRRTGRRRSHRGTDSRSRPPGPTLEAERAVRLAEVNARIADKRAAAAAEVDAAKLAARSHVESAVAEVASFAGELATGKAPSTEAVRAAVAEAMGVSA